MCQSCHAITGISSFLHANPSPILSSAPVTTNSFFLLFQRRGTFEVLDSSNDPAQQAKYDEIIELLLAAGYFRARIQGLSPFDKVIGGLAWAITSSYADVEVDVFFQEDAPLGTKM